MWIACLAGLALIGYLGWHRWQGSSGPQLLLSLPPNAPLQLTVDVQAARRSPSAMLLAEALLDSPYGVRAREAGLLEIGDLSLAVISLDAEGGYSAAGGSFSPRRLRRAVAELGGQCPDSIRERPCTFPADSSGRIVSLLLPADDLLLLAYGRSSGAVEGMRDRARSINGFFRLKMAKAPDTDEAIAHAAVTPGGLRSIAQQAPSFLPNLAFVAKAFEKAERAAFTLEDGPSGSLLMRLDSISSNDTEAKELRELLFGLNEFAAAAANYGRGDSGAADWATLLRSARFEQTGRAVTAIWTCEREILRRLAGG